MWRERDRQTDRQTDIYRKMERDGWGGGGGGESKERENDGDNLLTLALVCFYLQVHCPPGKTIHCEGSLQGLSLSLDWV